MNSPRNKQASLPFPGIEPVIYRERVGRGRTKHTIQVLCRQIDGRGSDEATRNSAQDVLPNRSIILDLHPSNNSDFIPLNTKNSRTPRDPGPGSTSDVVEVTVGRGGGGGIEREGLSVTTSRFPHVSKVKVNVRSTWLWP